MSSKTRELPREGDLLAEKYVVERVLGSGGMGVVVAARHQALGQRVALKFLLPEALNSTEAKERFVREARAVVDIKSEHVARVIDVGTLDGGAPYIVMERLEGRDLRTLLLDEGALPVEVAVDYVLQAAEAVAEAHSLGIVHRDLKPANVFVARRNDGSPLIKVLDFGISKALPSTSAGAELGLTRTDAVLGSPAYMAPEQIRSAKHVDTRVDIWAFGVLLYELLGAALPFDGDNLATLSAQICMDPPRPLRDQRADIPDELARIVDRCLAKDPSQRYRDLGELARALHPFAPDGSRELVARIGRLSRSIAFDETVQADVATRPAQPSTPGALGAETVSATAQTLTAERTLRSSPLLTAALVGCGVLVVAALTTLLSSRGTAPAADRPGSEPPAAVISAAPIPVATPPEAPSASASAPAPSASAPARRAPRPAKAAPQTCPVGLVWQGSRCDRPLATKVPF